jgi:hypothetical protein
MACQVLAVDCRLHGGNARDLYIRIGSAVNRRADNEQSFGPALTRFGEALGSSLAFEPSTPVHACVPDCSGAFRTKQALFAEMPTHFTPKRLGAPVHAGILPRRHSTNGMLTTYIVMP